MDLETQEWQKLAPPPFTPIGIFPNVLHSFQGKPTFFGYSECASNAVECRDTLVLQYDPVADTWSEIGSLNTPRNEHAVLEVG